MRAAIDVKTCTNTPTLARACKYTHTGRQARILVCARPAWHAVEPWEKAHVSAAVS